MTRLVENDIDFVLNDWVFQFPFHRQPSSKFNVVQSMQSSASLLHVRYRQ